MPQQNPHFKQCWVGGVIKMATPFLLGNFYCLPYRLTNLTVTEELFSNQFRGNFYTAVCDENSVSIQFFFIIHLTNTKILIWLQRYIVLFEYIGYLLKKNDFKNLRRI